MLSSAGTYLLPSLVLIGFGVVLVGVVVTMMRHSRYTPVESVLYAYAYLMARVLWRAETPVRLPVEPGQGAIIVCNHHGPFDPVFIQLPAGRVVHWMVAHEYFDNPIMKRLLRLTQSIPVSRGGIDTAATKTAIRYAQAGGLVGLFPEGRINTTDQLLLPGRPGAALIAMRARVPVIPCFVSGSPRGNSILGTLCTPAKVRLVVGRPIDISSFYDRVGGRESLEKLTKLLMVEIARLAGQDEFQPTLAGRRWLSEAS